MSDCPETLDELEQIIATYNSEITNFTALYNANLIIGFTTGVFSIIVATYVLLKTKRTNQYKPIMIIVGLLGLHSLDILITVICMSL